MAIRFAKWLLLTVVVLLALVLVAVLLVVNTQLGTRVALNRIQAAVNAGPDMVLRWNSVSGTLLGGLQFDGLHVERSTPTGGIEADIENLRFAWQALALLDGTLVLDEVSIDGLAFTSEDDGTAVTEPLTPARLQDMLFGLPITVELQSLNVTDVQLGINGSAFAFDSLSGMATLDASALQLQQLAWQQGPTRVSGDATLEASLAVAGELAWQTRLSEQDYAGSVTVSGALQQLALDHALTAPLQVQSGGTVVPAIFAGETLNIDLSHRFDTLDLASFGQPGIVLQQGDITTRGALEALAIMGALQANLDNFAPLENTPVAPLDLSFNLVYAPDTLAIDAVQIGSSQIDLAAAGVLQFDPLQLQIDWNLARLDPGTSLPAVQLSETSGAGSVQLGSDASGIDAAIVLTRLEGLLNGYPLMVSGNVALVDSQPGSVELQASNQDNRVAISGTAAPELALDWQIDAPVLSQLWDGLDGQLAGQGSIAGTVEMPQVNGELNGQQLQFASGDTSIALQSLAIDADYNGTVNDIQLTLGELALTSGADGIQTTQQLLQQAQLRLNGTPEQHQLTAEISSVEGDADMRLNGALTDGNWLGTLQSFALQSDYGDWELQNPADISWLDGAAMLEEMCLRHAPVEVCLQGSSNADAQINADLQIAGLPLAWLNPVDAGTGLQGVTAPASKPPGLDVLQNALSFALPENVRILDGDINVSATLRGMSGGVWDNLALDVQPTATEVQISRAGAEPETAEPEVHRFIFHDVRIQAGNSMDVWDASMTFQVTREEDNLSVPQGGLQASGTMTAAGDLDGNLAFNFNDLAWAESFVPQLRSPAGSFTGTATVRGNRDRPLLTSELRLRDGSFELPQYGLAIADVEMMLHSSGNNDIVLDLNARSGDGSIALTADISRPLLDTREVTAQLRGDNFQVWNAAQSVVAVTPDLQFSYAEAGLDVSGRVEVPEMNLDLAALFGEVGENTVTVSRDVVVVRTAEGEQTLEGQQGELIPVTADVTLVLGEDVMLRGFGLNAGLTGELSLEQSPNRPLLVYGELIIPEGTYEIYNQELSTQDGRLMFFGNPANPVVDIRAFRETRDAEVGMQLSGSIDNMRGELYSTPTLPDNEILALLVTGKSFNNVGSQDEDALLGAIANFGFERSGGLTNMVSSKLGLDSVTVGSDGGSLDDSTLGLGKYITPNLLMRYKLGIFDRQSVLSIEYNLTERLKLMVETGISQSVDLSYTIEKD